MNNYQFKSVVHKSEVFSKYPEIQYYLDEIIKEYSPSQVILFGSKARLDANKRSDSDFAISA
ncbi:MAG: hypothetical protein ABIO44_14385, partial [Saprospiraceae bacterium]